MRYVLFAAVVVCLCASSAIAQSTSSAPYPKLEIFAGYSANGIIGHSDSSSGISNGGFSPFLSDFAGGPKGFEASLTRDFNKYLGIKGDFSMYFDKSTGQVTLKVCSQGSCTTFSEDVSVEKRAFYFMAGPEIKWRNKTRLTPFAHALFGVARSTVEVTTTSAGFSQRDSDTRTGFAAAFGGGLDIRLSKRFSIRGMMDYTATFLGDANPGVSGRQNHVRLSLGIVFGK